MPGALEPRTREQRAVAFLRDRVPSEIWIAAAVAVPAFLLAYDHGGFSLSTRAVTAIAAWWALLLGIGLGLWPRTNIPRLAWIVVGLLAAFALWTGASIWWAQSAERAFTEFNRVTMYLAVLLLSMLGGGRRAIRGWADGFAFAIAAVAVIALLSRLFGWRSPLQGFPVFLPGAVSRLSFPVGYWNGLAIFVGFGYALWLGLALRARRWWTRALALAPFPSLAAVIYLSSSRGGVAAALLAAAVFVISTSRRWAAAGALAIVAAGSGAAVAVLLPRHELVDGPILSRAAATQGHQAFALIVLVSLATGAAFALGHRLLCDRAPSRAMGWALVAILIAVALVAVFSTDPAQRLQAFKHLPGQTATPGFVRTHLLSGSGNGRWQFWAAAVDEWRSAPVIGRGAGSYEPWWAQHASFSYFVRNAHSLYLEVLGELGIVGLLLLLGAFSVGLFAGVRTVLRREGEERIVCASLLGVVCAFLGAAAVEWIWQLTAISAVALACLGLLVGPAASAGNLRRVGPPLPDRRRVSRFAVGATVLALGWGLLWAQALPWLSDIALTGSAAALARGDGEQALRRARDARALEPWAASPYLQVALVQEQRGKLPAATTSIDGAIERDPVDWRLWLVAARLETKRGRLAAASQALERAIELNPRSPLFRRLAGVG